MSLGALATILLIFVALYPVVSAIAHWRRRRLWPLALGRPPR